MKKCDEKLMVENENLSSLLDEVGIDNRPIISSRLLQGLRNFVEHVMIKIYCEDTRTDLDDSWESICSAELYCQTQGQYYFLVLLRQNLHGTSGHRTIAYDYSEAVFLMYIEELIKIKNILKKKYNCDVLQNLSKYPKDLDDTFLNHYRKIWSAIKDIQTIDDISSQETVDMFYIQKKKPLFFDGHIMYELILTSPSDNVDKFDRFVAFSQIDIFSNYAVRTSIVEVDVEVFGANIPIKCINGYSVSIRACELENLATLFGINAVINRTSLEYRYFMEIMKARHIPFSSFLNYTNSDLNKIQKYLEDRRASAFPILNIVKKGKAITDSNKKGSNILRYLFYSMRNRVIKAQKQNDGNPNLSNLRIKNGSIYFDDYPFCCNLCDSKQSLYELIRCIDINGREPQLLSRELRKSSDETGKLYTNIKELKYQGNVEDAIRIFNSGLNDITAKLAIAKYGNKVYLEENEKATKIVIKSLLEKTKFSIRGYKSQADSWIIANSHDILGEEKKDIISNMFDKSTVYLIYGAAGTGKSTIIRFIFKLFGNVKKLCLAPTYPSLENMMRKIDDNQAKSYTLQRFVSNPALYDCEYDVAVVDECSVVSNRLMNDYLRKLKTKVLILSGDIYQIPSIDFGNWFHLAKSFLPDTAKCELTEQFRTDDVVLKELWEKVRSFDKYLGSYLEAKRLVRPLGKDIFDKFDDDEVILCLNYDGLFGVNNINLYLQTMNDNETYTWYQYTFKVGDPVLFSDTNRFSGIIYNNLKGVIKKISKDTDKITFDVSIDRALSSVNFPIGDIEYVDNDGDWTIVRFSVYKHDYADYDKELSSKCLIPFHIAYAVSIHKAQGLEYNSVKIVLANNVEDNINHNIFYTAITRARKKLMIYWTPETENAILSKFEERFDKTDCSVLKSKWNPS